MFGRTQVCVVLLHASPPHACPNPTQSVSFVHGVGVPPGATGFSPGATLPPPIRLVILAILLFSCSVERGVGPGGQPHGIGVRRGELILGDEPRRGDAAYRADSSRDPRRFPCSRW